MAADVSSLIRILNGGGRGDTNEPALITRDLLGGSGSGGGGGGHHLDSRELVDLDMQVPSGWEKRLDLKSGKVYLQRCDSTTTSSSSSEHNKSINNGAVSNFQDLNLPPSSKQQQPMNLFDDGSLDLKLVSSSTESSPSNYQSVCTLDKVKSALERAEKETNMVRKRSISMSKSSSPSRLSNNSSSSTVDENEEKSAPTAASFAAGCPNCLLYVLISASNPKCPRCSITVPLPNNVAAKKPRIDLNISI
ncbi:OLC1v1022243C1 [Oldenlandia corymbosa var. corymbosa]|uniref:OLC1v1022243C1 n=1 Tax=Oldenlandia corymbosa var. corymbosa TaxID=529605 RepID=A0AAV1BXE6_OLDCO|nr:OLC1v1022243C1 [Oldenlandia corymbosa var. corymbosa]